ncbi:protein yippee-like 3 isoform X2 [Vicugna pacos]|uniref:Protein yippee-like n=1 Tax=Vicugna pacos TaxID=30538 RepID=A0ABM5BRG9_VICPA
MVRISKPKTFQAYLDDCHRRYSCAHCRAHLANHDDLISKSFQGSQGRAYLFNSVVNVGCGPAEERVLLTGLHAVADIHCENCKTTLGWKYRSEKLPKTPQQHGAWIHEPPFPLPSLPLLLFTVWNRPLRAARSTKRGSTLLNSTT